MDLPLWTLLLLSLLYVILVRVIGQTNNLPRFAVTTSVLVVLMVLTRPESIVVVPALLFLGVFVEWCALSDLWRSMRPYAPSLVTLIIAVAILTFARLIYFGMPFPNTYYAKVSANPLDNFTSGARYIFRFITNEPYGEVFVFGASASFLIFGIRTYFLTSTLEKQQSRFGHAVFVLSSTVLLLLGLPLFTGGDNFGAFRFYQPFYPLLFVPVFLLLPGIFRISAPYLARTDCRLKACGVVVIAGALILLQLYGVAQNYLAAFRFYQPFYPLLFVPVFLLLPGIFRISAPYLARTDRRLKVCGVVVIAGAFVLLQVCGFYIAQHHGHLENRMVSDFKLAAKGRRLGTALNTLYKDAPDLRVAVVAAGGIALTYNGRILDLMGLNWIQMAHASRRRTGISGHSAFNEKVFWSARPELINPVLAKSEPKTLLVHEFDHKVLKAIMAKEEFQAQYTGVSISVSDGYIVGFARTDWIGSYAAHHKVRMYKWSEVQTQKHV
jgi:hypothetical protein